MSTNILLSNLIGELTVSQYQGPILELAGASEVSIYAAQHFQRNLTTWSHWVIDTYRAQAN